MDTEKQPKETFVEQMERVNRTNPFMIHNNIRAVALSEDAAEVCAEVTEDSLNAMQTVHGGLMFVMAEIAAGLVTRNDGRKYVTLDSSFRFLRGSSAKKLRGVAKITKRGKTVCFTKSQVMESETGKVLAEGEFTSSGRTDVIPSSPSAAVPPTTVRRRSPWLPQTEETSETTKVSTAPAIRYAR